MLTISTFREERRLFSTMLADGARQATHTVEVIRRETRTLHAELTKFATKKYTPQILLEDKVSGTLVKIEAQIDKVDKRSKAMKVVEHVDKALEATKKLVKDFNSVVSISIGSDFTSLQKEMQEAFRERALYAAKGKTDQQIQAFDEMTREIVKINPNLQSTDAMKLISASEQLQRNPDQAKAFAEQAAQLGVTTTVEPKELLSMMTTMGQLTGIQNADRLANSIQYMSNTLQEFSGKELEAIIAYSKENEMKLDSPEKLATLVVELDKQRITGDKTAPTADSLKQTAEKVASGEIRSQVGNEASTAYQKAMEHNPFLEFQQAQKDARQAVMELGMTVSRDVLPVLTPLANGMKAVADTLNGMPGVRIGAEIAVGVGLLTMAGYKLFRFATQIHEAYRNVKSILKPQSTAPVYPGTSWGTNKGGNKTGTGKKEPSRTGSTRLGRGGAFLSVLSSLLPIFLASSEQKESPEFGLKKYDQGLHRDLVFQKSNIHSFAMPSVTSSMSASVIPSDLSGLKKAGSSLLRKVPILRTIMGATEIVQSDNKLETAARIGAEALGGWGGAAAGAALGATVGSVVPVFGTAVGGVVGGILGGIGGAEVGGMLFDKVKDWWQGEPNPPPTQPLEQHTTPVPLGPPAPVGSPVSHGPEKAGAISVTIPQISVPLYADGVLQDIPTMLNMLNDPSIGHRIKVIIEKALLDSLETRGGVAT